MDLSISRMPEIVNQLRTTNWKCLMMIGFRVLNEMRLPQPFGCSDKTENEKSS